MHTVRERICIFCCYNNFFFLFSFSFVGFVWIYAPYFFCFCTLHVCIIISKQNLSTFVQKKNKRFCMKNRWIKTKRVRRQKKNCPANCATYNFLRYFFIFNCSNFVCALFHMAQAPIGSVAFVGIFLMVCYPQHSLLSFFIVAV